MIPFDRRIVIDGNDGTGKTTLVNKLSSIGFSNVCDRGEITKATDSDNIELDKNSLYIVLNCPWELSKKRLEDKPTDYYHTTEALQFYEKKFLEIANKFNINIIDSELSKKLVFEKAVEIITNGNLFKIGLPSGRLQTELFNDYTFMYHQLVMTEGPFLFLKSRPAAFPKLVAFGELDIAVCGSDSVDNSLFKEQLKIINKTSQNNVRMVVASDTGKIPNKKLLRVATKFRNIAEKYFGDKGIPHTIFDLSGSIEGFVPTFADVIVDIVQTGNTLEANKLKIIEEVSQIKTYTIKRNTNAI